MKAFLGMVDSFTAGPAAGRQRSSFPRRATVGDVLLAPYAAPLATGAANWGTVGGKTSQEWFPQAHPHRMGWHCRITRVRFHLASVTGITGIYVKIWRGEGNVPFLADITGNLAPVNPSGLQVGMNSITLPRPLEVEEGDRYSIRVEWAGAGGATVQNFCALTGVDLANTRSITNEDSGSWPNPSTTYSWGTKTSTASTVYPVEFYTDQAPDLLSFGNSLTSGNGGTVPDPAHASVRESSGSFNPLNSWPRQASLLFGGPYRTRTANRGKSGDTSSQGLAVFQAEVIDRRPGVAWIEFGTNDIVLDTGGEPDLGLYLANMRLMIGGCLDNNIRPVVPYIHPYSPTPYDNPTYLLRQARIAVWNRELRALTLSYGRDDQGRPLVVAVDMAPYLCVAGSSAILEPSLTPDGTHFYRAGKVLQALAVAQALQRDGYARYAS